MSISHLPSRSVLCISGKDKDEFLQGLITNDIHHLDHQPGIYACLLTPQGKYLYDFFVVKKGEFYYIDCEATRRDSLHKKLRLHRLRSSVEIETTDHKVYAVWNEDLYGDDVYPDPRLNILGSRLITSHPQVTSTEEDDYILFCHQNGVPYHSHDLIPQKSILLESNLDELNAISWNKGCYLGQELTARTKYRGLVRKRLFPVKIEGGTPDFGEQIVFDQKNVGEMRSSSQGLGMALLRTEVLGDFTSGFVTQDSRVFPYIPGWMRV